MKIIRVNILNNYIENTKDIHILYVNDNKKISTLLECNIFASNNYRYSCICVYVNIGV